MDESELSPYTPASEVQMDESELRSLLMPKSETQPPIESQAKYFCLIYPYEQWIVNNYGARKTKQEPHI